MAPPVLLIPLLILAAFATVIASQSIISGEFSVTQQAVQLGYLPRVRILHASSETRVTVETALTPEVVAERRLTVSEVGAGLTRVIIRFGFAESPDVSAALAPLFAADPHHNQVTTGYFISRQTFIPGAGGLSGWRDHLFAAMARNAESPIRYFNLPANRVVEVGSRMNI